MPRLPGRRHEPFRRPGSQRPRQPRAPLSNSGAARDAIDTPAGAVISGRLSDGTPAVPLRVRTVWGRLYQRLTIGAVGSPRGIHGFAPALTSFVGRAGELAEVAELLHASRMVTVAGPGGVGKTRFAGEAVRRIAGRFADGAWMVELAAVRDGTLVPGAVAGVLGLPLDPARPAQESLAAALARLQLLLVLDNCEHVLPAAAALCRAVLLAADDVRVLATSREPLRVAGETRYRLRPLAVTGDGDARGSDAVILFADRARQADPRFRLDDRTGPLVARTVARLDGMPLAIELAAARIEALGLDQLAARLENGLWLLANVDRAAAPRHQSLAAAVDWSYRLLGEAEQQVFRRLAVFPGPFTLEAAVAVAGARSEPAVLHLVDCSLLTPPSPGADGRVRYVMLEILRAFGRERLAEAGEGGVAAGALTRYALAVAEQAAAAWWRSTGELATGRWLDAEHPLLHQALAWSLDHDHDTALRLAIALAPWRLLRGRDAEAYTQLSEAAGHAVRGAARWGEAQFWLGQTVSKRDQAAALAHYRDAQAVEPGSPSAMLALALAGESNALNLTGRLADGAAAARRALAVAREAGAPGAEAAALLGLCQASWFSDGDAVGWARQACRIDPATIPGDYARDCRTFLTVALTEAGDLDEARETAGSLLALSREAGDLSSEAVGLFLLADVEVRAGRVTDAWERLQAAVRAALDIQHRLQLMVCLPIGAELCAAAARWPDVVTLYAARRAASRASGEIAESPHTAARREELTGRAVSELTPGELRRAEERGAQMTLETAADFLLIAQPPDPRDTPALDLPREWTELSPRELELVTLVACGRTDAQIAGELHISLSTVRSHLDRIRDKTSCRRRADLTRLALAAGLA
jgi:predicted ATPase/DNA-binding CsgD family transcriptional regulator